VEKQTNKLSSFFFFYSREGLLLHCLYKLFDEIKESAQGGVGVSLLDMRLKKP
jgi:hypothetical protein